MVDIVGIFPDLSFAKKRNDLKMTLKADQENRMYAILITQIADLPYEYSLFSTFSSFFFLMFY